MPGSLAKLRIRQHQRLEAPEGEPRAFDSRGCTMRRVSARPFAVVPVQYHDHRCKVARLWHGKCVKFHSETFRSKGLDIAGKVVAETLLS
jgi:hypothetical protein